MGNAVGRLPGFEIGLESVELGLKQHRRFSLGFRAGFGDRRHAKNLKETTVVSSEAVRLDPIPLGNNAVGGNSRGKRSACDRVLHAEPVALAPTPAGFRSWGR